MKRIVCLILMVLIFAGCSSEKPNFTYDIQYQDADMSAYNGVNSVDHNFKKININEFYNCVDNKSSAIFYFGYSGCGCCQSTIKYLNQAAQDFNVDIYYIDAYEPPLSDEDRIKFEEYTYDILAENEDGEKVLQTPTIFNVINGKINDYIICTGNMTWNKNPNESQINKLKNVYSKIFKPFIK